MLPTYQEVKSTALAYLDELETLRQTIKEARKKYYYIIAMLALTIVLLIAINSPTGTIPILVLIAILFIVIFVFSMKRSKQNEAYRAAFKNNVVYPFSQKIVELYELPHETERHQNYCRYKPDYRISDRWIYGSYLFDFPIDRIDGEDYFSGRLGLTDFEFSELELVEIRRTRDMKGNTTTHHHVHFNGVLFVADFKKHFEGITVVQARALDPTKGVGKLFAPLGKLFSSTTTRKASQRIMMESEAFNNAFHVWTSNELQARYILSSNFMEHMLSFKEKYAGKVNMSFVDSNMCIALTTTKNYFDVSIHRKVTPAILEEVYDDLSLFFGLIEQFDLNTRIWSKD